MEELLKSLGVNPGLGKEAILEQLGSKQMEYLERLDNVEDENRRQQLKAELKRIEDGIALVSGSGLENATGIKRDVQESFDELKNQPLEQEKEMLAEDPLDVYSNAYYIMSNEDRDKGFAMICELAEDGNVHAQYGLGWIYSVGDQGIPQDDALAVKWYQIAAEAGHSWAQGNLANCYINGRGVEQSDELAYGWYLKAAQQESPLAQRMLGNMYLEGRYVEQSKETAIEWWKKAAYQKELGAISNLAVFGIMP